MVKKMTVNTERTLAFTTPKNTEVTFNPKSQLPVVHHTNRSVIHSLNPPNNLHNNIQTTKSQLNNLSQISQNHSQPVKHSQASNNNPLSRTPSSNSPPNRSTQEYNRPSPDSNSRNIKAINSPNKAINNPNKAINLNKATFSNSLNTTHTNNNNPNTQHTTYTLR